MLYRRCPAAIAQKESNGPGYDGASSYEETGFSHFSIDAINPHFSPDFYCGGGYMPVYAASLRNLVRNAGRLI
jgi:hypothetical protein